MEDKALLDKTIELAHKLLVEGEGCVLSIKSKPLEILKREAREFYLRRTIYNIDGVEIKTESQEVGLSKFEHRNINYANTTEGCRELFGCSGSLKEIFSGSEGTKFYILKGNREYKKVTERKYKKERQKLINQALKGKGSADKDFVIKDRNGTFLFIPRTSLKDIFNKKNKNHLNIGVINNNSVGIILNSVIFDDPTIMVIMNEDKSLSYGFYSMDNVRGVLKKDKNIFDSLKYRVINFSGENKKVEVRDNKNRLHYVESSLYGFNKYTYNDNGQCIKIIEDNKIGSIGRRETVINPEENSRETTIYFDKDNIVVLRFDGYISFKACSLDNKSKFIKESIEDIKHIELPKEIACSIHTHEGSVLQKLEC